MLHTNDEDDCKLCTRDVGQDGDVATGKAMKVVVVLLSAAPFGVATADHPFMIRILIWHRFYAGCPS